jgi:hypothetical protein
MQKGKKRKRKKGKKKKKKQRTHIKATSPPPARGKALAYVLQLFSSLEQGIQNSHLNRGKKTSK